MKNSLIVFFILISFIGFGQGLNVELGFNDNYNQYSQGVVCANEYTYFVKHQNTSGSFVSNSQLCKIDTLGNIIWNKPITPRFAETNIVHEVLASEEGGVYVLGFGMPSCDVASDWFWYIQKYDLDGNVIWSRIWTDRICGEMHLYGLSLTSTNTLVVNSVDSSGSYITTLGSNGATEDSLKINRKGITGIEHFSGIDKVGFKADCLWWFDASGTIVDSLVFNSNIQGVKSLSDTLYLLTQDSIYMLDTSFQFIHRASVSGFNNYSHLKIMDGNIFFVSNGHFSQDIIQLDKHLQRLKIFSIPITLANNVHKDFNLIHFTAAIDFRLTLYTAVRYLDFSILSNQNEFVNTTDIGIVGLNVISVDATVYLDFQNVFRVTLEAEVLIKNYGTNPLNSCHISHFIGYGVVCNSSVFNREFDHLNIAPGDSMWVPIGLVHSSLESFYDSIIQKNICIYTSHPNSKTDLNVANDNYCKNVVFGYKGVAESALDEFLLYPNPTSGVIHLNLANHSPATFSVFNMQGTLSMSGEVNSNSIDISSLSNGIYFLRIFSADHQKYITRKVIKE